MGSDVITLDVAAARPAARDRDRATTSTHPVRRGRRRVGQDHRARRPGPRARRRRRRRAARRSPPSRSPRRPGAELRDRIRRELEARLADPRPPTTCAHRCRTALDQLDGAAIGTLHSLRPAAAVRAPDRGRAAAAGRGARRGQLGRRVRAALERVPRRPASPIRARAHAAAAVRRRRAAHRPRRPRPRLRGELGPRRRAGRRRRRRAAARAHAARRRARVPSTRSCARRPSAATPTTTGSPAARRDRRLRVARLRAHRPTSSICSRRSTPDAPPKPPSFRAGNIGQSGNWADVRQRPRCSSGRPASSSPTCGASVANACAHQLGAAIRRFTLAASRPSAGPTGRLEFHDLLVLARSLLRDPVHGAGRPRRGCTTATSGSCSTSSRTPTRSRSSWPCASPPPTRADRGRGAAPWDDGAGRARAAVRRRRPQAVDLPVPPRRHRHVPRGPRPLRPRRRRGRRASPPTSAPPTPVIDWVNHVFGALVAEQPGIELPVPSQPDYVALDAVRAAPPVGPPVAVLGRDEHPHRDADADALRAAEAAEVAATVVQARRRGLVGRATARTAGARPASATSPSSSRPARRCRSCRTRSTSRDPVPRRVELARLRHPGGARPAHGAAGGRRPDRPPRASSPRCARRCSACGDDDLFRFKVERRGRWSYLADQPDTVPADDPVRAGPRATCAALHDAAPLARRRPSCSTASPATGGPSSSASPRAGPATCGAGCGSWSTRPGRGARPPAAACASTCTGSTLQTAEGARVAEAVLPETDDDAVRIMTIHAAKGLEFPITIVSGMSTDPAGPARPRPRWCSRRPAASATASAARS